MAQSHPSFIKIVHVFDLYRVFKKEAPPETFWNIFTLFNLLHEIL